MSELKRYHPCVQYCEQGVAHADMLKTHHTFKTCPSDYYLASEAEAELAKKDAEVTRLQSQLRQYEDALAGTNEAVVEAMADTEHERWSGWHRHCARYRHVDSRWERWDSIAETPYAGLNEETKEYDRLEVQKSLATLRTVLRAALAGDGS